MFAADGGDCDTVQLLIMDVGDLDPIFDFCAPAMAASGEILQEESEAVLSFLDIQDRACRGAAANPDACVFEPGYL